tara:strand:- start:537 stop:863 length:327 start_codon:yes stop_codon:yes gene_type:complete
MALNFPSGELGGYKYALFNMGNGSLHNSSGVSSITRNTTATYTVNFSGNMTAQAYAVTAMGQYEWSYGSTTHGSNSFEAGSCRVRHGRYAAGVGGEVGYSAIMINGTA